MELRSTRSRSKTPFVVETFSEEATQRGNHVETSTTVVRTTRKTTGSKSSTVSSSHSAEISSMKPAKKTSRSSKKLIKTSDYSSEDGEFEVSSNRSITENEKNQILEDARALANGSGDISALELYRKSGRYWDKYPKTDYTYSYHSKDRFEIAPGEVIMPNMSRRTIHNIDCTLTDSNHKSTNTESIKHYTHLYRNDDQLRRKLFNNNYEDSYEETTTYTTITRRMWWRTKRTFLTVVTTIMSLFYYIHRVQTSVFSKLHRFSSWVMLLDTYLMRKDGGWTKRDKLLLLCLLPLLLFGAWWLLSNMGTAVYAALFNSTAAAVAPSIVPIIDIKNEAHEVPTAAHVNTDEIVQKILNNPNFINVINNYQTAQSQDGLINSLRVEIDKIKLEMEQKEQQRLNEINRLTAQFRSQNDHNVAKFAYQLRRCCRKPVVNIDAYVNRAIENYLNNPEFLGNQRGFASWLQTVLLAKDDFESKLENVTQNLDARYEELVQENGKRIMDDIANKITLEINKKSTKEVSFGTITDDQIKKIVRNTLAIYDADKTGLVDYAMEPMGGQVVSTRCTESYHSGKAVVSVLGIPLWYPVNTPRTVITPGVNPGECWAFENFPGFLVIKLSDYVKIEAFSMEHVSKLLVPNGRIDSAPKKFEVYGLKEERDHDPVKLGEYIYDAEGEPVQFFAVQEEGHIFDHIELRITSNHGNPNYTCLYRFRVHGKTSHQ